MSLIFRKKIIKTKKDKKCPVFAQERRASPGSADVPRPLKPAYQEDGSGIFSRIISSRALPPGTMG
jgi:hypothetical protein